jgi:hypothetical protein
MQGHDCIIILLCVYVSLCPKFPEIILWVRGSKWFVGGGVHPDITHVTNSFVKMLWNGRYIINVHVPAVFRRHCLSVPGTQKSWVVSESDRKEIIETVNYNMRMSMGAIYVYIYIYIYMIVVNRRFRERQLAPRRRVGTGRGCCLCSAERKVWWESLSLHHECCGRYENQGTVRGDSVCQLALIFHESPTFGPAVCVMRPAATFVNCVQSCVA